MTYEEAIKVLDNTKVMILKGSGTDLAKASYMAVKALEKQISKKVGKLDMVSYGSPYYCPECEVELIPVEFFNTDGSEPEEKVSYCWKCGRAIDWSEEK